MRIIERYPLGLRIFLGKGWYSLLKPARYILAWVYGMYLDRNMSSKRGTSSPDRGFRVVSIGNIEAGGSGKTPVTLAIACYLMKMGKRVVVVTRGYRSAAEKQGMPVVSVPEGENINGFDGSLILAEDLECKLKSRKKKVSGTIVTGDEVDIYKSRKIPVVIDPDRYRGIEAAGQMFCPDYILLDDAFRHTELSVDLNILLLDAQRPFGNHHLIPAGTLRERPETIERADVVIFTRSDNSDVPLEARILTEGKKIFFARHEVSGLVDRDFNRVGSDIIDARDVILFSGIAHPESFERTISKEGIEAAVSIRFNDHHDYTRADVDMIRNTSTGKPVYITTEKDINKVKSLFDDDELLLALGIEAVIPGIESLFSG